MVDGSYVLLTVEEVEPGRAAWLRVLVPFCTWLADSPAALLLLTIVAFFASEASPVRVLVCPFCT